MFTIDFLDDWGITLMIFAPLVGAALMMVVPGREEETHKLIALAASLVSAVFGVMLLANFDYDDTKTLQFSPVDGDNNPYMWIEVIKARYEVGIDGISLPLVALTLLVVPLVIIYSWNHIPEPGTEPVLHLRDEGDFRNKHQHSVTFRHGRSCRFQVDLGLAAAGDAGKKIG